VHYKFGRSPAGRVFRCNIFFGDKPQKMIFTSTPNVKRITNLDLRFTFFRFA
jgi:hypothetical protein